jgi:transcriptional regulator GlxA family with amidase domain
MSKTANIVIPLYDGVVPLDISGPSAVFGEANNQIGHRRYSLFYLAPNSRRSVTAATGLELGGQSFEELPDRIDLLLVPGADTEPLKAALEDSCLTETLCKLAKRSQRLASVCSGAFLLANAGLIPEKNVTTHWSGIQELKQRHPDLNVVDDCLYVQDDSVWTSAGVLSGVDMSLQMVKEDLGHPIALKIARRLVAFLVRPGGQSQYSSALALQSQYSGNRLEDLVAFILENLDQDFTIADMANYMCVSERSIHRLCQESYGMSPGRLLRRLRLDRCKQILIESDSPLKMIAKQCGFSTPYALSKSFKKAFGITPNAFRSSFQ